MGTVVMLLVTLLVDAGAVVPFSAGAVDMVITFVPFPVVMGTVVIADVLVLPVVMGTVVTADEFVVALVLADVAAFTVLLVSFAAKSSKSSRFWIGTEIMNRMVD
jgi:hypothetical protein